MVPPKFNTHEDCREAICCCCGTKTAKKRISLKEESLVKEHAKEEYDSKIESYPAGLCPPCRTRLFECGKAKANKVDWDWLGRPHPKLLWDKFELQNERFDPSQHSALTCTICQVAKYTPVGQKKVSRFEKPKLVSKGEPIVNPRPRANSKKICPKCKVVTGPGLSHFPCTFKAGKKNVVELIGKENVPGQEQILSEALKNVVNEKGGEPGEELRPADWAPGRKSTFCDSWQSQKGNSTLDHPRVYGIAAEKAELQPEKAAGVGPGF